MRRVPGESLLAPEGDMDLCGRIGCHTWVPVGVGMCPAHQGMEPTDGVIHFGGGPEVVADIARYTGLTARPEPRQAKG